MGRYLKWLGQNDDIYNMYLDWKEKGVSANFKWIMGISAVHSNCRCGWRDVRHTSHVTRHTSHIPFDRLCIRLKEVFDQELGQS